MTSKMFFECQRNVILSLQNPSKLNVKKMTKKDFDIMI